MKRWNKYTLETTTEAVDLISYTLNELGIEGVEVEDHVPLQEADKKKLFIDILPDMKPDDGKAYLSFYIDEAQDSASNIEHILAEIKLLSDFVSLGSLSCKESSTADEDWINNWKEYWKPFMVAENIMIKPTWETLTDVPKETLVVQLDPGTSFGTGMHHTTKLCISQLKKYLEPGQKLLDIGCGSGILSIIGLLLGAGEAAATDIDVHAVATAVENAKVNHILMDKYKVLCGDVISDKAFRQSLGMHKYDLVVANILADVIIPLAAVIKENMCQGGLFISSGIINSKETVVKEALIKNGFEIVDVIRSDEWVSFSCQVWSTMI